MTIRTGDRITSTLPRFAGLVGTARVDTVCDGRVVSGLTIRWDDGRVTSLIAGASRWHDELAASLRPHTETIPAGAC